MNGLAALVLLLTAAAAQESVVEMPVVGEPAAGAETDEEKKRLNRRRDVNEFGAHERPWAHDAIKVVKDREELDDLPGLAQSANRVEQGLTGAPLDVPRALEIRAVDMAAAFDALASEQARIDTAWDEIATARATAAVAQRRAIEEIERLAALKQEVAGLIGELETKEDANLTRMASLISQMSAKKAAELLASNDPDTVLAVLGRLDDRQSAEILGRMEERRGQELMVRMADKGRPEAGRTGSGR